MPLTFTSRVAATAAAGLSVLALATGCGSDDSSSSSSNDSSSNTTASSGGGSANTPTLDELFKGSYEDPPSSSPPPAKGKSVWWISCSQAAPSCAQPAAAAGEAAKALGIEYKVADGKFNQGGAFSSAIRTALAADPDAILLWGVACELTKGALEDAKAQGVLVMGAGATPDCADSGGPKLFSVPYQQSTKHKTATEFWKGYGAVAADYVIAQSDGKAKIITQEGTEPLQKMVADGFNEEIKKCSGCEVVERVPYSSPDLSPNGPWIQSFRTALTKHPDATAVWLPWEVMWSIGGAQAVAESGRKLITFGGQGAPDGLPLVRQGKITAVTGAMSQEWGGYAAMDTINRALQGKESVPQGIGFQAIDKEQNMPPEGENYKPPIDFKAAYLKAWQAAE